MEFFQYDFIQRAFLAGLITAVVCPLIGAFVVVRRQALIGDGLGHIAFAGIMGGHLLGIFPTAAAATVTMLGAAGIEFARRRHSQHADTALAIFFYSGIALAVIFSSMARVPGNNLLGVLFGSILTVSVGDLGLILIAGLLVVAAVYRYYAELVLIAFDEEIARVSGVNANFVNLLFSLLTALVVVVGMQVVGILLVSALMVIPVASAHLLRQGFRATLAWAVAFSALAVICGLVLAFFLDIAPGGTIVVTAVAGYILTLLASRRHGAKLGNGTTLAAAAVSRDQKGD
ncbi:MAG TPA: metal ABC transporter permease [Selenomonadales bacterium]|nr:metal ABC transporter permease [Selenomonadales bacterium]